jgi:hypothetical protein
MQIRYTKIRKSRAEKNVQENRFGGICFSMKKKKELEYTQKEMRLKGNEFLYYK